MSKAKWTVFILSISILSQAQSVYNISNYGAKGDNKTLNTVSIQKAIDDCNAKGGGQVLIPNGVFVTGTLVLKSNVTIYLSQNATLKGSANIADYPDIEIRVPTRIENIVGSTKKQLLFAENATNIGITGEGTFHPNGEAFQDHIDESPNRPYGLRFVNCNYVSVSNIHMRNSAYWMQRYLNCDHLRLSGLKIWNHCNLNNDGIDIDGCHDVIVSDCFVESSDDGICLKSEGARSCEDVVVTNCIVSSFASGLKLGTGSLGGFRRIAFSNCVVRPTKSKVMSHNTGSWGGLAGIDILEVDGALSEYISFNNIIIDSSDCPIFIKLGNRNGRISNEDTSAKNSILKNISLSNIQIKNGGPIACAITGYPGNYIENVSFDNITTHTRGEGTDRDTSLKIMENSSAYPVSGMFASNLPAYGFYFRHVKNISFSNVQFETTKNEARPALVFDDIQHAFLSNVRFNKLKEGNVKLLKAANVHIQSIMGTENWNVLDTSKSIIYNGKALSKRTTEAKSKIKNNKLPSTDSLLVLNYTFENATDVAVSDGIIGKSAQFSKGNYINLGKEAKYNFQSDITVAFWMKLNQPEANKYYRILTKRKAWNDPAGFEFEINPALNRLNFSGGNTWVKDQGLVEITFDNQWHYYTATLKDSRLRVYMDGKLVGWDDYVAMPSVVDADFVIGANSSGNDSFEGALDELKIWKRALNPDEITKLFKSN